MGISDEIRISERTENIASSCLDGAFFFRLCITAPGCLNPASFRTEEKIMVEAAGTPDMPVTVEALGVSESFLNFQEHLSRVAVVNRPVLLVGERGTGKELAAKRLHYLSRRWDGPLVALNCAALAPTLIESELFGNEPGAFTGAVARRHGRFEAAGGGTLFLDELGNIPLFVQEKILRVVEYGVFERVGGSEPVSVDVRLLGATNVDLPALAATGRFMRDLLDRLSFEVLFLPPLRERREDILLLAHHFAARMAMELGSTETPEFSPAVKAQLEHYAWPGNIRELKNVVERAVYRAEGRVVNTLCFEPFISPFARSEPVHAAPKGPTSISTSPEISGKTNFREAVETYEIGLLRDSLRYCRHHQRDAAAYLGLTYHQFRGLYRKYERRLMDVE